MPTLIQVTIKTSDNVPANFCTNQLCMFGEVEVGADSDAVTAAIKDFYDDINANYFPTGVAQNGHIVKYYDAEGTAPNYPYLESTFNLASSPTGTPLPSEVALCLSFQGVRIAGIPQARRRGRIYLGPLDITVMNSGRPTSTAITNALDAAEAFYDAVDVISSAQTWAVWSPTNGSATPVTNAWMDNAFDTQRSRGVEVTTKTTRVLI